MNRASRLLPQSGKFNSVNIGRLGGYYKIKNYVNCDYLITNTLDLKNYIIGHGWDSIKLSLFQTLLMIIITKVRKRY